MAPVTCSDSRSLTQSQAAAYPAREEAIGRLMTVLPHATSEERRIYAEWVVDGILDASAEMIRMVLRD